MKLLYTICLIGLVAISSQAQTAKINFRFPNDSANLMLSLTAEKIQFKPSPAIGLTDIDFANIGFFDVANQRAAMTEFELKEPQLVKLQINTRSNSYIASNSINYLFYIRPNDNLTIQVNPDKTLLFSGTNAETQQYMYLYFKDNFYSLLPSLGFDPKKIDNSPILPKIEELKQKRETALITLNTDEDFKEYIRAATQTEDHALKMIVSNKIMRNGQGVKLTTEQSAELDNFTLQHFKIRKDAALLSESYRNELRNFIKILVAEKYPSDPLKNYLFIPDALQYAYTLSGEKLKDNPKQIKYLHTYWLDQAVTYQKDMTIAKNLLADFERQYSDEKELISYFKNTIAAKQKMQSGQVATDFLAKDADEKEVTLQSLRGKAVCLIFCFNLKQHEQIIKPLEVHYGDKLNFVYVNVTPNTPFEIWKNYTEKRLNVTYLWLSDDAITKLTNDYAPTMMYPFVLIDAQGKIIERWIAQGFPDNPELKKEIANFLKP